MFGDDGRGGGGRARARGASGSATSSTPSSPGRSVAAVRGPPRAPDAEAVMELDLVEAAFGITRDARAAAARASATAARARAASPGTHPTRCDTCGGAGEVRQVRRSILGQLVTAAPCHACGGHRAADPEPVHDVRRRRPGARDAPHRGRGAGRHRRRAAAAAHRARSRGAAQRHGRRPLRHRARAPAPDARAPRASTSCTSAGSR